MDSCIRNNPFDSSRKPLATDREPFRYLFELIPNPIKRAKKNNNPTELQWRIISSSHIMKRNQRNELDEFQANSTKFNEIQNCKPHLQLHSRGCSSKNNSRKVSILLRLDCNRLKFLIIVIIVINHKSRKHATHCHGHGCTLLYDVYIILQCITLQSNTKHIDSFWSR